MTTLADRQKPENMTKATMGNLPPLVLLEVGEAIEGWMQSVDVVKTKTIETVKGKKVQREKERVYYRIELAEDATAHAGKKGADGKYPVVSFKKGDVISLPGAGGLDSTMAKIALKIEKKSEDDDADFSVLHEMFFKVNRLPDDVMKQGEFKGNKVKVYDVEYGS